MPAGRFIGIPLPLTHCGMVEAGGGQVKAAVDKANGAVPRSACLGEGGGRSRFSTVSPVSNIAFKAFQVHM